MTKYLFIFGNHPVLSLVELESVFELVGKKATVEMIVKDIAMVVVNDELDIIWWQKRLGGTVKIAKIKTQVLETMIGETIKQLCQPDKNKKFIFGISSYNQIKTDTNKIGMNVKRSLVDRGIKTRFVVSRENILSSVIVNKNKLLTDGEEFILVKIGNEVMIALTESVQDFAAFGERDYGRPAADAKNGMLPPKLAKIMINLAQVKDTDLLVDPYCGSGTVLQEALLMGCAKVHGSDISEKAVNNSRCNLEWLAKKNPNLNKAEIVIKEADALEISKAYKPGSIAAIVTEPYLGPVDRSNVVGKQEQLIKQLEASYTDFIVQANKVLKKGGRLVMVVPIIFEQTLNYKGALAKNGFKEIFPATYSVVQAKYSRANQRVERLIVVAQKQK